MEQKRYQVELVVKETVRYVIDAADPAEAERIASDRWHQDDDTGIVGEECWDLDSVHAAEVGGEEMCCQDCEEALRFLRDRELVIEQLDGDVFNPTVHDAVSAEEVARHLDWMSVEPDMTYDVGRAARALDRLCAQKRVVCFERPRVRKGEGGDVRLFCTPQHLELLAGMLDEPETVEAGAA